MTTTELATIKIIPVVYQKNNSGNYVLDARGEKTILKIGNDVLSTDDWESFVYTDFVNEPKVDVVTNLAEVTMSKTILDVIVPTLSANTIRPGMVLYENWGNLSTIYANDDFDASLFKTTLQTEIDAWAGVTNYESYFNTRPYDLQIAYESYLLDGMHGDGVNIPGITNADCILSIQLINETLTAAKEVSVSSRVYSYNMPLLPYNMPSPSLASDWYQRSNYSTDADWSGVKTMSLKRFSDKINAVTETDLINIEGYLKHFAGYTYPSPPEGAGYPNQTALKANGTKEFIYASCFEANKNIKLPLKIQIQTSPVVYSGYSLSILDTYEKVQNLPSLIWSDTDLTNYVLSPAKQAGARSMFIWGSWNYDTILAARAIIGVTGSNDDNLTWLKRKMFNDLFIDTGYTGTIGITNDSAWAAPSTKIYALTAATQKIKSMALLFRYL